MKIVEGKLFRDTDSMGKMDPYCVLEIGKGKKLKTRVHNNGGKTPRWGDSFEIRVENLNDDIRFTIMDEDVGSDDKVGWGIVSYANLCFNNGVKEWFSIFFGEM